MHPVLLKGQSLTIERPQRLPGMLVAAAAALLSLGLALALAVKGSSWPISFPQFLAYTGAGLLAVLALVFAFWTYACASLRYRLDRSGLTINWGPLKHFVPLDRIKGLVQGRGEHRPRSRGLNWWGHHIGRGRAEGLGEVLFFSTHRSPEDLVYVRTADATYALSPHNPLRFMAEAERLQQAPRPGREPGQTPVRPGAVQRSFLAAHPIWADRVAQWLAAAGVLLNLSLWGYLFAVYQDLSREIAIQFPPIGEITELHSRREIFKIPGTATALLAANLVAGLGFEWRERAATYLLLSGAVFLQVIFWIGAVIAVLNA